MPRVLLVDDSALSRRTMRAALEPYGLEFGEAENGQTAIQLALSSSWDLIFLDLVMPVIDGPAALRIIRARGCTTPVVLVTSVAKSNVLTAALQMGAVEYIVKPFTPEVIRGAVEKVLGLSAPA